MSRALLFNEKTIPKLANSLLYSYNLKTAHVLHGLAKLNSMVFRHKTLLTKQNFIVLVVTDLYRHARLLLSV